MAHARGSVPRVAADVQFVDGRFRKRYSRWSIISPVKLVGDDPASANSPCVPDAGAVAVAIAFVDAPGMPAAERAGIRINDDRLNIEPMTVARRMHPVHAIAVLDLGRQSLDENVPNVASAVADRIERNLRDGVLASIAEQDEVNLSSVTGKYGEVNSIGA